MSCGSGPSTGGGWGGPAEIINLNVGGTKFSTSKQTLIAIPVSFFFLLFQTFDIKLALCSFA